ncbi:MAG TPA: molybdopterin dinucleotide binding domain-containing protein, partial [Chloroflexota bacterium]|nr:molybdopterin dinucleotide binding domain-containing protein [Chloroflexota bacterium]
GRAGAQIDGWTAGLTEYAPEQVGKVTGVSASRITRLARELAERTPAVAIVGGAPLAHTNGLFTALAVNALNALLGSVDQPGGLFFTPQIRLRGVAGIGQAFRLQPEGNGPHIGEAQVLLVDGANPVFTTPAAWKVRDALEKIPFIASFSSFLDETTGMADLILPDHSFLESWVDALPESGSISAVASVAAPVMRPLHQTRATTDVLLDISRRLATPIAPALPWQTFNEMIAATFMTLPPAAADGDAWAEAQMQGGWWGTLPAALVRAPRVAEAIARPPAEPRFDGDAQQFPFHLLPYASSAFLDGSLAHLPWLQEMPDPLTSAMWSNWVEINNHTAKRLGIGNGDIVEITSSQGTVRAPAVVSPGLAPDVVAMPVGQGHRMFTRYATGRGSNPLPLIAPLTEAATGEWAWAATRVKVARVGNPDGSLIMFAGGDRERPYEELGRG